MNWPCAGEANMRPTTTTTAHTRTRHDWDFISASTMGNFFEGAQGTNDRIPIEQWGDTIRALRVQVQGNRKKVFFKPRHISQVQYLLSKVRRAKVVGICNYLFDFFGD